MSRHHPPYHLRPQKAIDRYIFLELIGKIIHADKINQYVYYGFGGPLLQDFRVLHQNFPNLSLFSIEEDAATILRQKYNLPNKMITIQAGKVSEFLSTYEPTSKSIFWLDFTKFDLSHFEDFQETLQKVFPGSIVKITLNALKPCNGAMKQDELNKHLDKFIHKFDDLVPAGTDVECLSLDTRYIDTIQKMVRIAAEKALRGKPGRMFHLLTSFFYSDGASMITITGIVSDYRRDAAQTKLKKWEYKNLNWSHPAQIIIPELSIKERLRLDSHLPCEEGEENQLENILGYEVPHIREYAKYYRLYPYFTRVAV